MNKERIRLSLVRTSRVAAVVITLLALFTGLYAVRTIRSLQSALTDTRARLAQSEEARISGLYDLERSLGSLRQEGTSDGDPSEV